MGRAVAVSQRAGSGGLARPVPRPREAGQYDDSASADGQEADLDAYIVRLLDAAPPLTSEQRDTLALLLRRPRRRVQSDRLAARSRGLSGHP
jgi:hypothetical protein